MRGRPARGRTGPRPHAPDAPAGAPTPDLCARRPSGRRSRPLDPRRAQFGNATTAGLRWTETGYVFTTGTGTPIEPDNLRRSWYPLRAAVGLDGVVFHGLRHTCVTLLLDVGAPPHVVRDIVGHWAIDVTMTIYAHASLDEKRSALKKLGDHLR